MLGALLYYFLKASVWLMALAVSVFTIALLYWTVIDAIPKWWFFVWVLFMIIVIRVSERVLDL